MARSIGAKRGAAKSKSNLLASSKKRSFKKKPLPPTPRRVFPTKSLPSIPWKEVRVKAYPKFIGQHRNEYKMSEQSRLEDEILRDLELMNRGFSDNNNSKTSIVDF
jgi:hypothetical protein